MKVLVTGAAGFVGDALCRHLASAGHIVEGTFRTIPAVSYTHLTLPTTPYV